LADGSITQYTLHVDIDKRCRPLVPYRIELGKTSSAARFPEMSVLGLANRKTVIMQFVCLFCFNNNNKCDFHSFQTFCTLRTVDTHDC